MKIGVIADVHSNIYALRSSIEYMRNSGCTEFFLLGDYVSDTANPVETMDELYSLMDNYPCYVLRGNREEYLLKERKFLQENGVHEWKKGSGSGNLLFTYEHMTQKDLDYFESLPISFVYRKEDLPAITCCHGAPDKSNHLLQFYNDDTKKLLLGLDTDYLIAAHTHIQGILEYENKMYVNTGAMGVAMGEQGIAHCIMMESYSGTDGMAWKPILLSVPYDWKNAILDMHETGLFEMAPWFVSNNIHILLTGEDLKVKLIAELNMHREDDKKNGIYIDDEEYYYESAAKKIGLPFYDKGKTLSILNSL